jgi:hypothetical protein
MSDLLKLDPRRLASRPRQVGSSLLGLSFDGSRLEGVELRRTNGSVEVRRSFGVSLSLDPLANDPELVGREIRKHLDAAGVRERRCAVCVPLNWVLTLTTKLPELPEADLRSFLQIEAERGFPYGPEALMLAHSCFRAPGDERYATQVAIPRDRLSRLESVLQAAQLRPVGFSLGIAALQRAEAEPEQGVLALAPSENSVNLQISCGGGVAALRTVEGAFEAEGGARQFQADHVLRELRITLGQLPSDVRESVRRVRIFGRNDATEEIAEELDPRVASLGIRVEPVKDYAPDEFGVRLPADAVVSPALSVGMRYLTGRGTGLEFLPPKVSAWKQFAARYSSRKLVSAGATAGAVALIIALAFLVQQWQLIRWQSKWSAMKTRVIELEAVQQQIKRFRPWFDESFRSLSILRRLTEAFPEDGSVTAKTFEVRESSVPGELPTIVCSGAARNNRALLQMTDRLGATREVTGVHIETRGSSPLQFTLNFQWNGGGQR